jgi:hypothetical protein
MNNQTPYQKLIRSNILRKALPLALLLSIATLLPTACSEYEYHEIETTAYCPCGKCNCWKRGTFLFWNKYVSEGSRKGKPYTGDTASGKRLQAHHPGLFSADTLRKPWMIAPRLVFFPWLLLPQKGTIAAETTYFPFGTKMHIPGYGWGVVEDRGGAIKGPARIDLYHPTHKSALKWGRQTLRVKVIKKK